MSFALGRKVTYQDTIVIEDIVSRSATGDYQLKALIKHLIMSDAFLQTDRQTQTAGTNKKDAS